MSLNSQYIIVQKKMLAESWLKRKTYDAIQIFF